MDALASLLCPTTAEEFLKWHDNDENEYGFQIETYSTEFCVDPDHCDSPTVLRAVEAIGNLPEAERQKVLGMITDYRTMSRTETLQNLLGAASRRAERLRLEEREETLIRPYETAIDSIKVFLKQERVSSAWEIDIKELKFLLHASMSDIAAQLEKASVLKQARSLIILQEYRPQELSAYSFNLQFYFDVNKAKEIADSAFMLAKDSDEPGARVMAIIKYLILKKLEVEGKTNITSANFNGFINVSGLAESSTLAKFFLISVNLSRMPKEIRRFFLQ